MFTPVTDIHYSILLESLRGELVNRRFDNALRRRMSRDGLAQSLDRFRREELLTGFDADARRHILDDEEAAVLLQRVCHPLFDQCFRSHTLIRRTARCFCRKSLRSSSQHRESALVIAVVKTQTFADRLHKLERSIAHVRAQQLFDHPTDEVLRR